MNKWNRWVFSASSTIFWQDFSYYGQKSSTFVLVPKILQTIVFFNFSNKLYRLDSASLEKSFTFDVFSIITKKIPNICFFFSSSRISFNLTTNSQRFVSSTASRTLRPGILGTKKTNAPSIVWRNIWRWPKGYRRGYKNIKWFKTRMLLQLRKSLDIKLVSGLVWSRKMKTLLVSEKKMWLLRGREKKNEKNMNSDCSCVLHI